MIFINHVGPGVAPLDPSSIPDLSAWYDPDDAATLTLSGSSVTAMADKQGSADFVEISGQGKPSTTTIGGRTWLQMGGSSVLHVPSVSQAEVTFGNDYFSIAVVVRTNSITTNIVALNKGSSALYRIGANWTSTPIGQPYAVLDDGPNSHVLNGAGPSGDVNDNNPHLLILVRDNAANEMRLYQDGQQVSTSPMDITGLGSVDDATYELLLGAVPFGGTGYARFWPDQLAECLMVKRALSASEIAGLRAYCQAKWGTP